MKKRTFIIAKTKSVEIDKLINRLKKAKQQGVKKISFEDRISTTDPSDIGIDITELGAKLTKAGMEDLADELVEILEEDEEGGPEEYLEDLEDAYDIEKDDLEDQDDQDAFGGCGKKHKKKK